MICCGYEHTSAFSVAAHHIKCPFQRIGFGYVISGRKVLEAVKFKNDTQELVAVCEFQVWRRMRPAEIFQEKTLK